MCRGEGVCAMGSRSFRGGGRHLSEKVGGGGGVTGRREYWERGDRLILRGRE